MLTQPLTRPLTRKIHRAQLTSIRYRDFDPLSLEPYLLFDAESSMLGNLENPTLDLDASDNGSLDVITATRAGIATFTAADGQIVTADENTVRVDWSLGYPAMLIEPSATNLVEYSEDFNNSYWSKNDVTISTAPVAAPDGTMTASHVVATGSNAHLAKGSVVTSGSDTISIWARTVSGAGTCFFNYHGGTPSTVTDQWQRFEVTANSANVYPVNFRGDSTLDEIYIWGAQAETGSVATSYIPTSGGSVAERTRNADNLVIDGTAFSDFYNGSEGTFYVEIIDRTPTENSAYLLGQSLNQGFMYSNVELAVDSFDGAYFQRISGVVANELFRAAATYNSTTKTISLNGTTSAVGTHGGNWSTTNILNIGWGGSGVPAYGQFNGFLKRLLYWPTHSSSL